MYAILTETKETIALKKKQIEEKQNQINANIQESSKLVNDMHHLKGQVEMLETDLYRLEKRVLNDESRNRPDPNNGTCCVKPSQNVLTGNSLPIDHPSHPCNRRDF